MNDSSNSLPPSGDDALEARIVAWVLGEASPFEATELEKLCSENPELRDFERRTRDLHEILAADATPGMDAAWKLPAGKREKVTDLLGVELVEPVGGKVNRYFARRILLAAAACVAISLVSYPLFSGSGSKAKVAMAPEKTVDFMAESPGVTVSSDSLAKEAQVEKLRRAVVEQEERVEDKRQLLAQQIRLGREQVASKEKGDLAIREGLDASSYNDRQSDFDNEERQLEELRFKLVAEETKARVSGADASIALNDSPAPAAPAMRPPVTAMPVEPQMELPKLAKQEAVDAAGAAAEDKPSDPADLYFRGWLFSRDSEKLKTQGDEQGAKTKLAEARQNFERVQQEHPGWKKDMVLGRLAETEDQLSQLGGKTGEGKVMAESGEAARANTDFIGTVDGVNIPGVPAATGVDVTDVVTAGLRSGDGAINRNNIDAVLNNPSRTSLPGQASSGNDALGGPLVAGETGLLSDATQSALKNERSPDLSGLSLNQPAFVPRDEDPSVYRFSRQELVPRKPGEMPIQEAASPDGYALNLRSRALAWSDSDAPAVAAGERMAWSVYGNASDNLAGLSGGRPMGAAADPYALPAAEKFFFGTSTPSVAPFIGTTRELSYSSEYQAPELPNSLPFVGGLFPATSATPTRWESEETKDGYSGLAQKEMIRRQAAVADADRLLVEGREAYTNGKYKEAHDKYQESLAILPDHAMVEDRRKVVGQHLNDAATALSDAYRRVGKYEEAAQLAHGVLARDPQNVDAKSLNEWLGDPIRTNPALTYKHTENVDKIRRSLYLAEGAYNLGKYDDASKAYEDVIRIDPYNQAARRGMERVAIAKTDYYRAAYDHTRAELLSQVDAAWELSVPPVVAPPPSGDAKMDGSVSELAQKERARRQTVAAEADRFVEEGRKARETGDLEAAYKLQTDALGLMPEAPAVDMRRAEVKLSLGEIAAGLAVDAEAKGKKDAAKEWAGKALQWNPEQKQAKGILNLGGGDETRTAAEPFSTFSLHVSDASFKLAKAALDRGEQPDPAGIRPEEFYNAFDYGDPAPAQGEPVVCVTEQAAHPVLPQRNLVRVGVRAAAEGRGGSVPLNLTLLLDSSGSMEREDRQAAMLRAVEQLSGLLKEGDTITMAGFARQPRLLADRMPGARAQELNKIIAQTPSEGGTNLEEGLKLAEELAKRQFNPAVQNRIVLFTDGAANLGDAQPESLQARVEQLRQEGIAFDAAGFGADGLNDRLLERLTRNGNGRYYVVDRAEDAGEGFAKQLAGAFRPAAENVKVQVRFNPARVARYKLIGFEEHRLAKEDFKNDAVDAAEMAAEEAGNALYQIEPIPGGEGEIGDVSVRFRDVASGQMIERTWTIPYEAQAPAFDQAAPSMQLAGLAAFAAEKLRKAPMADALDFQQLGKSFAPVRAKYAGSRAVEELGQMIEKLK
jgi:Mg-chelatase subunit ChlD/tetratricopeptide (TPR) repeat protein